MSKYLFGFICPACGQGNHCVFNHKCGGKLYIDEDLYLYCDKCSDKTYLFDSTFKCEYHDDYREPNKRFMLHILCIFAESESMPDITLIKMTKNVIKMLN